jgi:5'-3' exonuclease
MVDRRRKLVIDEAGVIAKFGVPPSSIADYLALVGDNADGYPGIPRWGDRSAATVLAEYRSIEAIPDDEKTWTVKGLRGATQLAENLRTRRKEAALYKQLATLVTDVPITESIADLEWKGPRSELAAFGESIGDRGLADRAVAKAN